jgi:SHS2 domain-containing protein
MSKIARLLILEPINNADKYGILFRRMKPEFGFREHAHTADWELEVWAPDLPSLLEQAARGMYALSGTRLQEGLHQSRTIALLATDAESLLVRFLTELLWIEQEEGLGFNDFNIIIGHPFNLRAELGGSAIANLDKEIKAVTYHNLAVQTTSQGLRVNIVFDV